MSKCPSRSVIFLALVLSACDGLCVASGNYELNPPASDMEHGEGMRDSSLAFKVAQDSSSLTLSWAAYPYAEHYQISIDDGDWFDVHGLSWRDEQLDPPLIDAVLKSPNSLRRDIVELSVSIEKRLFDKKYALRAVLPNETFSEPEVLNAALDTKPLRYLWASKLENSWTSLGETESPFFTDLNAPADGGILQYQVSIQLSEGFPPVVASSQGQRLAVSALAVGGYHSCALLNDKSARCWGGNNHGQLGDGTNYDKPKPISISLAEPLRALALGQFHSCALTQGGEVYCWGSNSRKQSGADDQRDQLEPQKVQLPDNISQLDVGLQHSCALVGDSDVYCWGDNSSFQLGSEMTYPSSVPVKTTVRSRVRKLAVGGNVTCVRFENGEVDCWGQIHPGKLPIPITMTTVDKKAYDLSVGEAHACFLIGGNEFSCWGTNDVGQLGLGDQQYRVGPVDFAQPPQIFKHIYVGGINTCALGDLHEVSCWGGTMWSVTGPWDYSTGLASPPSNYLNFGVDVVDLGLGETHACAQLADGDVKCWGSNLGGQLGIDEAPKFVGSSMMDWPPRSALLWED